MLGALLGLANMTVIAFGIALDLGEGPDAFMALLFLGSLPAILAGVVLGVVASRSRAWSIGARYAVLAIPAFGAVMLFGCVIIPLAYYIPFAFAPTFVAVRILEVRTRAPSSIPVALGWQSSGAVDNPSSPDELALRAGQPSRIDPIVLGMLLGLVNLAVIAIGMRGLTYGHHEGFHHHGTELCFHPHPMGSPSVAVFAAGFLPAIITGAIVGRIGLRTRAWPTWARLLVLVPPPVAVVIALGGMSGLYAYVLPSILTTVCAALCLERGTRETMVPVARAI